MQTKWLFGSLILLLAIAGISLEQTAIPNQEIVVQFTHKDVTLRETQDAVAIVKEQLQAIGVDYIQVQESDNGQLKITYHSDVDVLSIKRILALEDPFDLGYTSLDSSNKPKESPTRKSKKNYELNVYEIQSGTDYDAGFDGYVPEIETKSTRYFLPNLCFFSNDLLVATKNRSDALAYTLQKDDALSIENNTHVIPEVRAGPF